MNQPPGNFDFFTFVLWKRIIDVFSLFGIFVLFRILCPVSHPMNPSDASLEAEATPACCLSCVFRLYLLLVLQGQSWMQELRFKCIVFTYWRFFCTGFHNFWRWICFLERYKTLAWNYRSQLPWLLFIWLPGGGAFLMTCGLRYSESFPAVWLCISQYVVFGTNTEVSFCPGSQGIFKVLLEWNKCVYV